MLTSLIQELICKSPFDWVLAASKHLRAHSSLGDRELVLQGMPATNNADIIFLMDKVMQTAEGVMSWESLGWAIEMTATAYQRWQAEQQIELLITGPLPPNGMAVRRVDQALYDLVQAAKTKIVLVTFAAAKIKHLVKALLDAQQRGVHIRLILEFAQSSEGQLSFDALKAFPKELISSVEVYCWPIEKRERNQAGRPGKLHAKVALIDDTALISSANLTDDAFNRNLEMGVKLQGGKLPKILHQYFDGLCGAEVLLPVKFYDYFA